MSAPPISPHDRASAHSRLVQTCHLMGSSGARVNLQESNLPRPPADCRSHLHFTSAPRARSEFHLRPATPAPKPALSFRL